MKTRRFLLSAITTAMMAVAIGQRAMAQTLQVHQANGATTDLVLGSETTVKFLGESVRIASTSQTRDFAKADVLRFTYTILRHDVNGDGKVDVADIASVIDAMAGSGSSVGAGNGVGAGPVPARTEADVNGDGAVDVADIASVIDKMAELARLAKQPLLAETANGTIGEAFYIYRTDGQINGFLRWEIDSIGFSHYDADSLRYNKIASQVIYTADSIYCVPIAGIDSVAFVTPKTEYKPGVIDMSKELMPYVTGCDSLTITFSNSTPSALMPRVGDKLMTLEMNEFFPAGFAGEVVSVAGNLVECKRVPLEEIFESYYNVVSAYGYIDEDTEAARRMRLPPIAGTWEKDFKLNTFTMPFNTEITRNVKPKSELALKGGNGLSVEVTPTFHVRATLIVNRDEGTYFSASLTGSVNVKERISLFGGLEWSHDHPFKSLKFEKNLSPYVTFFFEPGLFVRAGATITGSAVLEQNYTFGCGRDWSTKGKNVLKPSCGGRLASFDCDVEACIDGSIAAGGYVELGFALLHSELDKICFRGEMGGEFAGGFMLYNNDVANAEKGTGLYERLRNSEISANVFVNTALHLELVGDLWGANVPLPWNLSYQLRKWDMVPTFSNTTFRQRLSPQTSADARTNMSGDCLIPVVVGLSVRDKDMKETGSYYASNKFNNGNKPLENTFTGLSTEADYTLYPKVRIFGINMLASPSAELERQEFPVEITDFKQTGSEYKKDGFSHNGKTYSYQYNCTVTVTLKDSKDVEDWGWVYRDPDGQEAFISLKSFSSPYSDSRYVYLRNEAKSTATVYPYVKLRGEERKTGEPHDYPLEHGDTSCPDENHPHWIDLGIGTQWRCCNEGASRPEEYGGYYTFGQVASAPTLEQIKALVNNCSYTWTTQNGVNGGKFTGPNGGTIFLPAAGYVWDGELYIVGSYGLYLSSTPSGEGLGYGLYFLSSGARWGGSYGRFYGLSVRPVR